MTVAAVHGPPFKRKAPQFSIVVVDVSCQSAKAAVEEEALLSGPFPILQFLNKIESSVVIMNLDNKRKRYDNQLQISHSFPLYYELICSISQQFAAVWINPLQIPAILPLPVRA